jgi:peptidoglycan/LPS O-acetylase OafA/YrhL
MSPEILERDARVPPLAISKKRPHFRYVDGFRGLAALYVVLHHALQMTWLTGHRPTVMTGTETLLTSLLIHGDSAVTFFMAISGFCLMLPLVNNESEFGLEASKKFFYRRARRILPPYYVALLLSMASMTVFIADMPRRSAGPFLPTTFAGIVSHLLLIQNVHESTIYQINGPMWSIAVECQIYLLFPLLVALRRSFGIPALLGITYVLALVLQSLIARTPYEGLMPTYVFVFALGMSAADFALGPQKRLFVWMGFASAALVLFMFVYPGTQHLVQIDIAVGVCSMCFLTIGAHWPRNPVIKIASWGPIAFLGTFSYSLYLVHSPLQQLLWTRLIVPMKLSESWTFGLGATAGTALILFLSYWFYVVAERPFCTSAS